MEEGFVRTRYRRRISNTQTPNQNINNSPVEEPFYNYFDEDSEESTTSCTSLSSDGLIFNIPTQLPEQFQRGDQRAKSSPTNTETHPFKLTKNFSLDNLDFQNPHLFFVGSANNSSLTRVNAMFFD